LVVNRHPASVFMGDTGSLALGGALGGLMACGGGAMVLPVFVASGVFVVESVSVILQKVWFRWTKRRTGTGVELLKMSPLHHHLELSGWGEMKIVGWFAACGAACSVLAIRVFYMGAT
jgi:phospho-N-acetylmuramoyl-pentapeptide-transferase